MQSDTKMSRYDVHLVLGPLFFIKLDQHTVLPLEGFPLELDGLEHEWVKSAGKHSRVCFEDEIWDPVLAEG